MNVFSKLASRFFSDDKPGSVSYFNIAALGGIIASIIATIPNIVIGVGAAGISECIVTIAFFIVVFVIAQITKKYNACIIATIYGLNFLLFPLLYFSVGGIYSGMPIYFVMGIIFTVLLLSGPLMGVTLSLECLWYGAVFYYSYSHPQIEQSFFTMGRHVFFDTAFDFYVVALSTAFLVKILSVSYEKQQLRTKALLEQLEDISVRDTLTGAYSRRFLIKYVESGIRKHKDNHTPFSVIIFDIDKFSNINEEYGHITGDEVLRNVTDMIMKSCRNYDVVARYAGERFVLAMPGASEDTAYARAEQIRKTAENRSFSEKVTRPLTLSAGVSTYQINYKTVEEFLDSAEQNLNIAKETGRNRVVWHDRQ